MGIEWIGLNFRSVDHNAVLDLAAEYAPELSDSYFDEITQVNEIPKGIVEEDVLSAEEKWQRIFKANLPGMYRLVSKFFCIPVSNAFVERIFSLTSGQWTDVRNSLAVDTVKSLTQLKVNFDLSCPEFYKMLISNKNLLKSIIDGQKYKI